MGKQTDYKRLWRSAQERVVIFSNEIQRLQTVVNTQADLLKQIRDGEIKLSDILVQDDIKNQEEAVIKVKNVGGDESGEEQEKE